MAVMTIYWRKLLQKIHTLIVILFHRAVLLTALCEMGTWRRAKARIYQCKRTV